MSNVGMNKKHQLSWGSLWS